MNKNAFIVVALVLAGFVGYVVYASNRLPAELKAQIDTEQKQLEQARTQIAAARDTVAKQAAAAPDLFSVRGFDTEWSGRLGEAQAKLTEAGRYGAALLELKRLNSKSSRPQIEDLLRREREREKSALEEVRLVSAEAQKRADLKKDFGNTLVRLGSVSKAIAATDVSPLEARVAKAERDWPSRKADLQTSLDAIENTKQQAAEWSQTVASLAAKPADQLTGEDYAQALDVEESVDQAALPQKAAELTKLAPQLYTSWDNVLVDLDRDNNRYRQRVKHVVTTVETPDDKGTTASTEEWADISPQQWSSLENDIGMTVAHKPFAKFDNEADSVPQPAGFAYMASPAEGRNRYGYWENGAGGSFWHWLPEYLILSSLLNNHYYQPVPTYDWYHYRDARQYGRTYYGTDIAGAPKFGSHGTFTQKSYSSSRYVQSGGFGSSKYASGGGFSGSKYGKTPSASSSSSGRKFGAAPSDSGPRRFGGGSSGRSFGSGSRSAGRSFGGGGRRR